MIKWNRNHILLIILLILSIVQFISPLLKYATWETTNGKVVAFDKVSRSGVRTKFSSSKVTYFVPIAEYAVSGTTFYAKGGGYPEKEMANAYGDAVTIIYDPDFPSKSYFLNFTGFWFSNYINKLVVLMVIIIALYSFIDKTQFLIIRLKPQSGERVVELTKTVKDKSLLKRLNRARQAAFGKGRHQA